MRMLLILVIAIPFSDSCTKKYTQRFRKQRFGSFRSGRTNSGDPKCPEWRTYQLHPIQNVIDNVHSQLNISCPISCLIFKIMIRTAMSHCSSEWTFVSRSYSVMDMCKLHNTIIDQTIKKKSGVKRLFLMFSAIASGPALTDDGLLSLVCI